jgi:hexulose-6-phosphate isomerase
MRPRFLGIMQGRLVPPVGERIQAFPAERWRDEFPAAREAGLQSIEWIYDVGCDAVNPIATDEGIEEMRQLSKANGVAVVSLCADYFMPEPLLRGSEAERHMRAEKLDWLLQRCQRAGIERVVLPFVDNSKLESDSDREAVIELLQQFAPRAAAMNLELHLETSLPPEQFAALLRQVEHSAVKVNFDSGNSSSLGYRVEEEFAAYGDRIGSVHIKDRVRGGGTVPLGSGDADLPALRRCLEEIHYTGDIILQVARETPGREVDWARHNREYVEQLLQ